MKNFLRNLILFAAAILLAVISAGCSVHEGASVSDSIVMVRNNQLAAYGTGFAVGLPGEPVETIITSYRVVATANGAQPRTAELVTGKDNKSVTASVIYCDIENNIAVLELPEPSEELIPLILNTGYEADPDDTVIVSGFSGVGSMMSGFEELNGTSVDQYMGNIKLEEYYGEKKIYAFSNEFNRAAEGGPAQLSDRTVIGMCVYSYSADSEMFSQYIIPTETLAKAATAAGAEIMSSSELLYKRITIISIAAGIFILLVVGILTLLILRRLNKNTGVENNDAGPEWELYIHTGSLADRKYIIGDEFRIGRDLSRCNAAYPVNEPGISVVHCTLNVSGGSCYLTDSSSYGVYREDGTRLEKNVAVPVDSGSIFYLADRRNTIEIRLKND